MFRYLILLSFFSVVTTSSQAQDYTSAVGLRLGIPASISYKQFVGDQGAIEVTAASRGGGDFNYSYRWYGLTAGYQVHNDLNVKLDGLENLRWYYGGGAGFYFWSWNYDRRFTDERYARTSFGIQGYLGLDYTFDKTPINISLDWTPVFSLSGFGAGFGGGFGSLGVRYVLNR